MAKQTVLVTGASGFVAAHVIKAFLDAGYNVRGTVRNDDTAKHTGANFQSHVDSGALTFAIVPDIATANAFDESVKGVEGVIHTASPFVLQVDDNKRDLLEPAINGTLNVLRSVKKNGSSVKRVVVTSSFASILDLSKGNRDDYTYSEKDWNPASFDEAANSSDGSFSYCASKSLAEKAAWDYMKDSEGEVNFTLATVCPPMVYGPAEQYISSMKKLNSSTADIYRYMNGSTPKVQLNGFWAFVDARDLAVAHVKAFENEKSQRYLVTGGNYSYQQVVEILRKVPGIDQSKVSKDDPELTWPKVYKVDNSRARNELGINFRSLEESITDTAKQLLELERKLGDN